MIAKGSLYAGLATVLFTLATFGCNKECTGDNDGDCNNGADDKDGGTGGSAGTVKVGGACTTAADCASGLTICNDDPGGQCTADCKTQADCAAIPNAICEPGGGHCYLKCTTNADCTRPGYACVGGTPGYMFCDPKHEVGDSCTSAADCADGLTICNGDPGGQCTADCTVPADCSAIPGAVCETDRPGHCYKECTSKADCPRDGYDCLGGPNPEGKKWCDVL